MDTFWKTIIWQQFGAAIDRLENAMLACPDEMWILRQTIDSAPRWVARARS